MNNTQTPMEFVAQDHLTGDEGNEFFAAHSQFFHTSIVGTRLKPGVSGGARLANRYLAIIAALKQVYGDASVLDLGAHDGRWAIAALEAGAKSATCVEPRQRLAQNCFMNAREFGLEDRISVVEDDMFNFLPSVGEGQYDVVLCLGIFYHTMRHLELISQFKRIRPKFLVLDTLTTGEENPLIRIKMEPKVGEGASLGTMDDAQDAMVGIPSRGFIDLLLDHAGLQYIEVDWSRLPVRDWNHTGDYKTGKRVTLLISGR